MLAITVFGSIRAVSKIGWRSRSMLLNKMKRVDPWLMPKTEPRRGRGCESVKKIGSKQLKERHVRLGSLVPKLLDKNDRNSQLPSVQRRPSAS